MLHLLEFFSELVLKKSGDLAFFQISINITIFSQSHDFFCDNGN